VLELEKNDLSSEGHLTKTIFIAVFGIFLHKNEYILEVLMR
jgi:hypothetical protein